MYMAWTMTDWSHLRTRAIDACGVCDRPCAQLVLLKLASEVTKFYAFYVHPKASMLRNATQSKFVLAGRFAEIGMKGALSALQFDRLDAGHDGGLDLADLCGAYGRIPGVTFERTRRIRACTRRRRGTRRGSLQCP